MFPILAHGMGDVPRSKRRGVGLRRHLPGGTLASGQINFDGAGTNGTGTITPSALEQSNVDLSTQLDQIIQ